MPMNLGVFEDAGWRNLLPLTWLRNAVALICGRDRLLDKIMAVSQTAPAGYWARPELSPRIGESLPHAEPLADQPWCLVNSRAFFCGVTTLPPEGTAWVERGELVAVTVANEVVQGLKPGIFLDPDLLAKWFEPSRQVAPPEGVRLIRYPWELALLNADELIRQRECAGRQDGRIYDGAHLLDADCITIERGATVKPGVVLDAEPGPIYLAEGATIEPHAYIEGPAYIGRKTIVRPNSVIRGGTTIGPVCKVAGEIEATIFHGYSNKQHDGFFGHTYVGKWVNIGADTITSDLKNTYGAIRVFLNGAGIETGEHFMGSIIGDHSKTGIGTILPTGCIVGVASNVFTSSAVPKFVPSFAWLTDQGMSPYRLEKALSIARAVMVRRDQELTPAEAELLSHVSSQAGEIEKAGWTLKG